MIYSIRHVEAGVKKFRGEGGGAGGYSNHSYGLKGNHTLVMSVLLSTLEHVYNVVNCSNLHIYLIFLHHRVCSDRKKCRGCGFVPAEIVFRY